MSMNEPNLDDLSLLIPGKFTLVTLAMKRARQLQAGAIPLIDTLSHKPVTIALQEILAQQVRALPMPPTEELEAKEQADLLAAIGLSEPTSVSVARRMEELIYGPEDSEEAEDYDEEYVDEDEDEALGSLGLDEDLEEPASEREESDFLPGEDETPELGADLSLDELDEDSEADEPDEEEEEEESFSTDDFGDALASPRKAAIDLGLAVDDDARPKTRGRKPGSGKVAAAGDDDAPAADADADAPVPAKRGRKPKAATP